MSVMIFHAIWDVPTYRPGPSIDLIMFLGPEGLKVSSYWKFCVDFRTELLTNQPLGLRPVSVTFSKVLFKICLIIAYLSYVALVTKCKWFFAVFAVNASELTSTMI